MSEASFATAKIQKHAHTHRHRGGKERRQRMRFDVYEVEEERASAFEEVLERSEWVDGDTVRLHLRIRRISRRVGTSVSREDEGDEEKKIPFLFLYQRFGSHAQGNRGRGEFD